MNLLELKHISFKANARFILKELDLALPWRQIHALVGTNGTGKSTLARMIMGCDGYAPDSGDMLFRGQRINDLSIDQRAKLGITMAWQEPARFEGLTVRNYLTLGRPDVDPGEVLSRVGLAPDRYLDRMVDKTLSGGERKRIELASVLALQPLLAILDEPASGIDMLSVDEIVHVIQGFKDAGASVLLITHREEITRIADCASQLCAGRIVCSGDPHKVADHYRSRACTVCDGEECRA